MVCLESARIRPRLGVLGCEIRERQVQGEAGSFPGRHFLLLQGGFMGLREGSARLLVLFAVTLLLATSAASQTIEKGEISGTITDPSGAVVPDATVRITHVATGEERTLTTGSDGHFVANLLPVGAYRIEVSAKGFATTIVKGV